MNGNQTGFRRLEVWQLGRELANQVFTTTKSFPKDEAFGLTSQLRRASVSIPSNIAEGWARQSDGAFANHLRIARASLSEVHTQLILANDFGYLTCNQLRAIEPSIDTLGRKLYHLLERLTASHVREEVASYTAGVSES